MDYQYHEEAPQAHEHAAKPPAAQQLRERASKMLDTAEHYERQAVQDSFDPTPDESAAIGRLVDTHELRAERNEQPRKLIEAGEGKRYQENTNDAGEWTDATTFEGVLRLMYDLHERKNQDYGRTHDPYANVRASVDFGVEGWVGSLIRGNDKLRRLQKAAQGGTLTNEGIWDSLIDLANYAVIAAVLYAQEQEGAQS